MELNAKEIEVLPLVHAWFQQLQCQEMISKHVAELNRSVRKSRFGCQEEMCWGLGYMWAGYKWKAVKALESMWKRLSAVVKVKGGLQVMGTFYITFRKYILDFLSLSVMYAVLGTSQEMLYSKHDFLCLRKILQNVQLTVMN